MSIQEGTFMTHFNNNVNRIKEIVSNPGKLYHHFETLKNTHLTLENLMKQFVETSPKIIKQEVFNKMMLESKKYQTSWKTDIVDLIPETYFQLQSIPQMNFEVPELFTDDVYDDLLQLVNLTPDPNNEKDKKMIIKYKNKVIEIFNDLNDLKNDITNFENGMIHYRNILENSCSQALKQIYQSHMSFMKFTQMHSQKQVSVIFRDEIINVQGRQTEVIPTILKKYLEME